MSSKVIALVGECALEVEEPDLVIYRLRGVVDGRHIRALRAAEAQWNTGKPYLLVIVDISKQVSATMDARRASTEPTAGTRNRALAVCGGDRAMRAIATLVLRASTLLTQSQSRRSFFDDEAAGRAWLFAQRADLSKRSSG